MAAMEGVRGVELVRRYVMRAGVLYKHQGNLMCWEGWMTANENAECVHDELITVRVGYVLKTLQLIKNNLFDGVKRV